MQAIKQELSTILKAYSKKVGCGFFTRRSRKQFVSDAETALDNGNDKELVQLILGFAGSMQGKKSDVGCLGNSRLQTMMWTHSQSKERGRRHVNLYQMLFDYLLSPAGGLLCKDMALSFRGKPLKLQGNAEQDEPILREMIGYNWSGNFSLKKNVSVVNADSPSPLTIA